MMGRWGLKVCARSAFWNLIKPFWGGAVAHVNSHGRKAGALQTPKWLQAWIMSCCRHTAGTA